MLLCEVLIFPLNFASNEIYEMKKDSPSIEKQYQIKSIYVYAYSLFESALSETLKHFLFCFPEKMDNKHKNCMEISELFESVFARDLVDSSIKDYLRGLGCLSLKNYIIKVTEILAVSLSKETIEMLINFEKMSEMRNKIVHRSIEVDLKKTFNDEEKEMSVDDFQESAGNFIFVLKEISCLIEEKYKKYTLLKAIRELWDYFFKSPLLSFDYFWVIKDETIVAFNSDVKENFGYLSSYEKNLLCYWLQQTGISSDVWVPLLVDNKRTWIAMTTEVALLAEYVDRNPFLFQGISNVRIK